MQYGLKNLWHKHLLKHRVSVDWQIQLSLSPCTLTVFIIQWPWVLPTFAKCFVHMCTSEGITNEAIVLEWLVSSALWLQRCEKAMESPTAQCKNTAVLSEYHCERVTQFWTSLSEEGIFSHMVTFWFGTFAMLFCTTGCVVGHENTWRGSVLYKVYKFTIFEILKDFFASSYTYVACLHYLYI